MTTQAPGTPAPLKRAGLLVALEAVALGVLGTAYAGTALLASPDQRLRAVLQGVLGLLVAVALLAVARGLVRGRGWAWAPAITTQLFLLVVGYYLVQGSAWLPAAVVLALAVGVLSHLAAPSARASYDTGDGRR